MTKDNNSNARRQKPANNNKQTTNRPSNYEFLPYTGTETEVVDDLAVGMVPSWRLLAAAAWHDAKYAGRNRTIASRLRAVAGLQDMAVAA